MENCAIRKITLILGISLSLFSSILLGGENNASKEADEALRQEAIKDAEYTKHVVGAVADAGIVLSIFVPEVKRLLFNRMLLRQKISISKWKLISGGAIIMLPLELYAIYEKKGPEYGFKPVPSDKVMEQFWDQARRGKIPDLIINDPEGVPIVQNEERKK